MSAMVSSWRGTLLLVYHNVSNNFQLVCDLAFSVSPCQQWFPAGVGPCFECFTMSAMVSSRCVTLLLVYHHVSNGFQPVCDLAFSVSSCQQWFPAGV